MKTSLINIQWLELQMANYRSQHPDKTDDEIWARRSSSSRRVASPSAPSQTPPRTQPPRPAVLRPSRYIHYHPRSTDRCACYSCCIRPRAPPAPSLRRSGAHRHPPSFAGCPSAAPAPSLRSAPTPHARPHLAHGTETPRAQGFGWGWHAPGAGRRFRLNAARTRHLLAS